LETTLVITDQEIFKINPTHYREEDYPEHKLKVSKECTNDCECPMCYKGVKIF